VLGFHNAFAQDNAPLPKGQKYAKKYDRKVIVSPFLGYAYLIPPKTQVNNVGDQTNLYAGFNPLVFSAGVTGYYPLKFYPRLLLSAEYNLMFAKQRFSLLNINALSIGAKFLLRDRRKKLNPYVAAGIGLPIVLYSQEAHSEEFIPTENINEIQFGQPLKFERRIPNKTIVTPMFSPYVTVGAQYRIDRKYSVFLQASINPVIGNHAGLREVSPAHNAGLTYISGRGGVNIQLMKPKPPYVDTSMIPIPDPVLALSMSEDYMRQRMLVLEGVFDIQLREGLKHNVRLEVGQHELLIEEQPQDPCKVSCYLYDEKGNLVSRAESTPEGKIVFTDLDKGIYDLTFILQKPCTSADFRYKFPDPSVHTLMQYNEEGTVTDSIYYNIQGNLMVPDTADFSFVYKTSPLFLASTNKMLNTNYDISVYLADSARKILARYEPGKNESFFFKKLPTKNYNVVYKVPDAELKTGINYTYFDNYKFPVKQVSFIDIRDSSSQIMTEEDRFYEKLKYNLKGKVLLKDSVNKMNEVTLYLVNDKKKIVYFKKPEKDGSFLFKNLRSKVNYEIYYELDNKKGKISISHKEEELVPLPKSNLDDVDAIGRRRRLVPELQASSDEEVTLTYSTKGSLVNPKGYGVYVGAFENGANVDLMCKKLIKDGFDDIAIQVGMTDHMNKIYDFTRNFKIHKVLVGEFEKERQAVRTKNRLEYEGYDAVIVKY